LFSSCPIVFFFRYFPPLFCSSAQPPSPFFPGPALSPIFPCLLLLVLSLVPLLVSLSRHSNSQRHFDGSVFYPRLIFDCCCSPTPSTVPLGPMRYCYVPFPNRGWGVFLHRLTLSFPFWLRPPLFFMSSRLFPSAPDLPCFHFFILGTTSFFNFFFLPPWSSQSMWFCAFLVPALFFRSLVRPALSFSPFPSQTVPSSPRAFSLSLFALPPG